MSQSFRFKHKKQKKLCFGLKQRPVSVTTDSAVSVLSAQLNSFVVRTVLGLSLKIFRGGLLQELRLRMFSIYPPARNNVVIYPPLPCCHAGHLSWCTVMFDVCSVLFSLWFGSKIHHIDYWHLKYFTVCRLYVFYWIVEMQYCLRILSSLNWLWFWNILDN